MWKKINFWSESKRRSILIQKKKTQERYSWQKWVIYQGLTRKEAWGPGWYLFHRVYLLDSWVALTRWLPPSPCPTAHALEIQHWSQWFYVVSIYPFTIGSLMINRKFYSWLSSDFQKCVFMELIRATLSTYTYNAETKASRCLPCDRYFTLIHVHNNSVIVVMAW